jgi:hypothetical protein
MLVKQETFAQNVRKNKDVLKALAALLTEEIQGRSSPPASWDFRFFLPLAQWLCEQGGYTMTPEGYNPGNVMGNGDAGYFQRSYNTEFINGVRKPVPSAKFAKYSTMKVGTAATFNHLQEKWPMTHLTILKGGSSDDYVRGLYPGAPRNYATAPQSSYMSGLRFRLKRVVENYLQTAEDDLKECDELAAAIPGKSPAAGESLDYRNDVGMNKNTRALLENLIAALKDCQKRVNAGQNVQP